MLGLSRRNSSRIPFADDTMFIYSAGQPANGFTLGETWHVLRVTSECAIAQFLGPVAMLAGLLAFSVRMSILRILAATTASLAGLILLNLIRLLAICFAWGSWGKDAFHWVHGPIGTVFMLLGLSAALLTFFLTVIRHRSTGIARS